jgi:uncharacterized membrane protein YbhN (UPF0104 family)
MIAKISRYTFVFSFILLGAIICSADWRIIARTAHEVTFVPIVLCLVAFVVLQVAKAGRFSVFLPEDFDYNNVIFFHVVVRHSFYLLVLPARLGDIFYSSLVKYQTRIPHRVAVTTLLIAYIYDLLILCLLVLIGSYYFRGNFPVSINILILGLAGLALILIIFLVPSLKLLSSFLKKRFGFSKNQLSKKMCVSLDQVASELEGRHKIGIHLQMLFFTIISWLCMSLMFWLVFEMFHISLGFFQIVFTVALVNLFSLIPIQTIGGFGLREAGMASAFLLFGMSVQESSSYAISARFVLYLVQVLGSLILLFLTYLFMQQRVQLDD